MLLVDYANNAAQYLSFFPLYNFYCVTLAIFFLPSNTVEDDAHEALATTLSFDDNGRKNKRKQKRSATVAAEMPDMSNVVEIDLGTMEDDVDIKKVTPVPIVSGQQQDPLVNNAPNLSLV